MCRPPSGRHAGQSRLLARFWLPIVLFAAAAAEELIKGISYGPMPCTEPCVLKQDDFMAPAAKSLWGSRFRGDLQVMKALGANYVRLYGNNPVNAHTTFLDEALISSMKVIIGMSDWPYTQAPDNCKATTNYDCYSQIKEQYAMNLKNGFLTKDGSYHPALGTVIVINEPDLKLPGITAPGSWCKGIISAVDGMIDAEKEAGVKGPLVNLTATFSFGICDLCLNAKTILNVGPAEHPPPGLAQMEELRAAFLDPASVGYIPRNDLAAVYHSRFTNSFNTANPAPDIKNLFLNTYEEQFHTVPVMIGEYHCPQKQIKQEEDLKAVLDLARSTELFLGISFFEYQVRYDKGGSEMEFGMFGMRTNYSFDSFTYFGDPVKSYCLKPQTDALGALLPSAVAAAYGGPGIDYSTLCIPDPDKVTLDQAGFGQIAAQGSDERMAIFVNRLVGHLGGHVQEQSGLVSFSKSLMGSTRTFAGTEQDLLKQQPSWALWDKLATCVADRRALLDKVLATLDWVCGNMKFDCLKIPQECKTDTWVTADYAFSMYWNEKQLTQMAPMQNCYFEGSAAYVSGLTAFTANSGCHVSRNPLISALTEEGYQEVLTTDDPSQTAVFLKRVVQDRLGKDVIDYKALEDFSRTPPATLAAAELALKEKSFVCGIDGHEACPTTSSTTVTSTTVATTTVPTAGPVVPVVPVKPPVWHDDSSTGTEAGSQGGGLATWKIAAMVLVAAVMIGGVALAVAASMNSKAKRKKAESKAKKERSRRADSNGHSNDIETEALTKTALGGQPFEFSAPAAPSLQQGAFPPPPPPPPQTYVPSSLGHPSLGQTGGQTPDFPAAAFTFGQQGSLQRPPHITITPAGQSPAVFGSIPAHASASPAASLLAHPRGGARTPGARTPGSARTPGMRTPTRTPTRTPRGSRARHMVRQPEDVPVREAPPPLPALAGGALRSVQAAPTASGGGLAGFGAGPAPGFGAGAAPAPGFGAGAAP